MTSMYDDPMLDAVGEVYASMGSFSHLDHYRRERDEKISLNDPTCTGHYEGYLWEARSIVARLATRGYSIVKNDNAASETSYSDDA